MGAARSCRDRCNADPSAVLVGTTTATLTTSADGTSTVTFTPGGTITLSGEYLIVSLNENVGVSGGNIMSISAPALETYHA
jgi:hypothetical protein